VPNRQTAALETLKNKERTEFLSEVNNNKAYIVPVIQVVKQVIDLFMGNDTMKQLSKEKMNSILSQTSTLGSEKRKELRNSLEQLHPFTSAL
jgi:hypothetical protein